MLQLTSLALLFALQAPPTPQEAEVPAQAEEVRLIVLVVVDQMIPEQLERMRPWLEGGLARFAEGEVWHNAAHGHARTETGPGHASIGTGVFPQRNGIVSNTWVDYASGEPVYCVGDPGARLLTNAGLGQPGSATSAKNLLTDGFAEYLRAANPAAKSIAIAGKDRAAILASGRRADLALWWEKGTGAGFCSSDSYAQELPAWVCEWNQGWVERAAGWSWEASLEDLGASGLAADLRPGEPRKGFPHQAPSPDPSDASARAALARWAYVSPLVDRYSIELAGLAVEHEELGQDAVTDLLFLGLSACDTIGHTYGPFSHEVTDLMLRLDRDLGELFDSLDARLGKQHWIAALSADHGVLPLPEALPAKLVPAQRVGGRSLQRASDQLRSEVQEFFGKPYFKGLSYLEGSLDQAALGGDLELAEEVSQFAISSLLERLPWLHSGYTRKQLSDAQAKAPGPDALLTLYSRSFHPARSLDFQMVAGPWVLISGSSTGTSHGSPWPYDRRVPMAFFGPGSEAGRQHYEPSLTVDLLPTLLQRAGVSVPAGLDGRILP